MKLIDLLVRELPKRGGWPEGFVMAWQSEHDCEVYFCKPDNSTTIAARGLYAGLLNEAADCRGINGSVTLDQYQSALAASQKVEWVSGLPPVGCECEDKFRDADNAEWVYFRCVGVDCGVAFGWAGKDAVTLGKGSYEFRPLRTEEEKNRDAAITGIAKASQLISNNKEQINHICCHIYDAIAAGKVPGVKLED